jgi:hypothetical protein
MVDFIKNLKQKNPTIAGDILNGDVERVIKARIGYSVLKDRVIFPEELRHKADVYAGSAGNCVRKADKKLKEGMLPFKCWVQYGVEKVSRL